MHQSLDLLPLLVVDPRYADVGRLLEMFGPQRSTATCPHLYEDSRVTDMLQDGAIVDGSDRAAKNLRLLLYSIKDDWMTEQSDERK